MVKIYSHSKLSSFEQCPQKYKYRYIDRIKVFEKSIEALLGSSVHNTLEYLYKEVKKGRIPPIDEIITIYSENWKDNHNKNIVIVKKEFTAEDYFNKGVKFIVDYYTMNQPFTDNTLETEKKIELVLDSETKIIGYIDRLVHNKEKDEYEVHDYKTANNLPYKESVDKDRQLALYAMAIKEALGYDKSVLLVWHYLAHNKRITSTRTNEQLAQLKREILALIDKVESATEFPPNKSILCEWCEYKKICPCFQTPNINKD